MQPRILVGEQQCDELLEWLDAHCVSLSMGAPLHLLRERWRRTEQDDQRLADLLALLIQEQWVELAPGLTPPHLRLSPDGYRRLLSATRFSSSAPPAIDTEAAPVAEPDIRPTVFIGRGLALSEIALRNQVLSIFRDLKLKKGELLIGVTVSRYWQETGLRAGDLRTAFDVLLRDEYVRHRIRGMDVYWELGEGGAEFIRGPLTPARLLECAPEITQPGPHVPDSELRDLISGAFEGPERFAGSRIGYSALKSRWHGTGLDDNALLHALDLAYKAGIARFHGADEHFDIELTESGVGRMPEQRSVLSKLSRKLGWGR